MHDRQLYTQVDHRSDWRTVSGYCERSELSSMLFSAYCLAIVVTFIHCKGRPRWISKTCKHANQCRILLAVSEPVAYQLVIIIIIIWVLQPILPHAVML